MKLRFSGGVCLVTLFCIICPLREAQSCAVLPGHFFMLIKVFEDRVSLGRAAAKQAAAAIRLAIAERGRARIIAATAASQLEFLDALTKMPGIDWSKVEAFHLDEYIGLPVTHPGSFRKMLLEQLVQKTGIANYHLLDGDAADPGEVVQREGRALASMPVDIAFLGIGENGHIAFNDPPADFKTEEPYIIVNLDEACRQQQVGEAWFADISQVPKRAMSMSARQILKAKEILAVVPGPRKAEAVKLCLEGTINPMAPASILRTHADTTIYLDKQSASLLGPALQSTLSETSQAMINS
jgi:glucosamine-6-phosphate deaminase